MKLITANRNYSSWSLRPWLLMKILDLAFEDERIEFSKPDNHDDFRAFSPTGKVPLLVDGERRIWDSLAISLYLGDRHDGVLPTDADARAWVQCVSAEMHSGFTALRNDCTMNVGTRVRRGPDSPALARDIARIAEIFEEGLSCFGGPYLVGWVRGALETPGDPADLLMGALTATPHAGPRSGVPIFESDYPC